MRKFFAILKYVRGYWGYAYLNIGFNLLSVIFSLVSISMFIPFLALLFEPAPPVKDLPPLTITVNGAKEYVTAWFSNLVHEYGKQFSVMVVCGVTVLLFLLKNLFRYLAMYFLAPVRNGVVRDIRNSLYDKVQALPISYFTAERKGDLMSRMTNDVLDIEWSVMSSIEAIFREPIAVLLPIVTMFAISPELTLLVFAILPVTGVLIGRIGKSLKKTSQKVQDKMGQMMSSIEETLAGLRIIKAFNGEGFSRRKFGNMNDEYFRLSVKMYRKRDLSAPLSEFLGAIAMAAVVLYGGTLVLKDPPLVDPKVFLFYIAVFSQIISPAKAFTTAYFNVQKGMASAERVNYIRNAEVTIRDPEKPVTLDLFSKSIVYRNVSFAYRREGEKGWVLKDVSLEIPKGKTIALVGQSGSGKTTLADLLPRFHDVTGGEVLIDGISVKEVRLSDLRRLMGIVTQESILFNDTVFNNIAFGMDQVSEEAVIEAAKVAHAHEFIAEMENGYHTFIGDRGMRLSGGQRQRISIARAILKNPPILILDEATSALDTESEKLVQDALGKLMLNRTSIIIAHRLSTIQHADEIVVLQKGEIIERGRHDELLAKNSVYKRLYDLQTFV